MANSARIDELRKKFDENPRRYFAPLANEYRKAGDQEQAIFICQEYLPQQPGHMSGHIVYGQALFELGRFDEAKAVFETALTLDPENLIALRHLGDIARQAGDSAVARSWYQRVLEADPRNEEIAQLMLSLLGTETPSAGAAAVDNSAPTPLSSPAVPEPEPPAVGDRMPAEDVGLFTVEKSPDDAEVAPPFVAPPEPPPIPETLEIESALPAAEEPPPVPVTPPVNASEELMDLDEFSIGGLGASEQEAASDEQPAVSAQAESAESPDLGFNLGEEEGPFEADPFAIAAQPANMAAEPVLDAAPQPEVELAVDLEIGLPDDSPVRAPPVDEAPIDERSIEFPIGTSAAEEVTAEALGGLETFEPGLPEASSVEAAALEVVAFDATPLSTMAVPSAPIDGGHAGDEVPAEQAPEPEPPEAFVTETMAELYLQQGHLESALDIYRKLLDLRPDEAGVRERMRAVEMRLYGTPESIDEPVAEPVAAGPTIREFLQSLVRPRTAPVESAVDQAEPIGPAAERAGETDLEPESAPVQEWSAEQELAREQAPEQWSPPEPTRPTPAATETVSGSIDALFSGAEASSHDSAAASTLAEAFAPEGPETAPLHGVPAHRASSELSLDHVFKSGTPPRGETADAFSFDQFFAEEVTQGPTSTDTDAGAAPREAPDDIAQFNAWLNGLKKT